MRVLAELKRRNVIRMAGLYLVCAWLVVQVAATLLPVFEAPGWVMKLVVVVLAIGFVAALAFSWIFELTPEGLKRDGDVAPEESIAPQTAQRMTRTLLLVMALALSYFALDKFVLAPERVAVVPASAAVTMPADAGIAEEAPQASIAVLPFVNMSADSENGFFADGISEELLNVLAGIDGLKVASRTSAFSFKGKDTAIPEIARQLGVRHVLEGSVRKQGQQVRITAQLIRADTDTRLWSETYDRELTDIFTVQEEIAQAITAALAGMLGERTVAVTASTENLDAYQSFLRGRARFHQRADLLAAIADLSKAVELDPQFGEAWVYLSATWLTAPGYYTEDELAVSEAKSAGRAALQRAQTLLPTHPVFKAMQANLREDEGDVIGALALAQESATLSTQDSNPLMWQGLMLLRAGYLVEATATLEKAHRMDPLAGVNTGYLAIARLSAGQYDSAEALARRALSQGWNPALFIIIYDLAAREQRARALALWDELAAPFMVTRDAERGVKVRQALHDPATDVSALLQLSDVRSLNFEVGIASRRFDLMLDLADEVRRQAKDDRRRQFWLRTAWLPSTLALREDPRFFAFAEDLGMVRLWEARGYPDGCRRAQATGGDHLVCRVAQQ